MQPLLCGVNDWLFIITPIPLCQFKQTSQEECFLDDPFAKIAKTNLIIKKHGRGLSW